MKSAKVAISNTFCTIHVSIADAEWMKSWSGVTVTSPPGLQRLGRVTAAVTGPVGLPGRHGNSCPKFFQN